jgi:hypothetical protein
MGKLNLTLTNNFMQLEIIAVIGNDAFLKRLNDNSFVVCRNLQVNEDLTCSWGYALGYFEHYNDAYACFMEKVVNRFAEYGKALELLRADLVEV